MPRPLSTLLLCGAILIAPPLATQQAKAGSAPRAVKFAYDVAVTYNPMRSNTTPGESFWMEGGSMQIQRKFYRGLGAVAEVAGAHTANIGSTGVGLDMVTTLFGPRYSLDLAHRRYTLYAQFLAGEANAFDGVFPTASGVKSSSDSLALLTGGGVNVRLTPRIALRALEADWLRTSLPNSTTGNQNNFRLGTGIVLRF